MNIKVNRELAIKVLNIVDHGLVNGLGKPEPGKMCIEAAVCYAMGLPHGDEPPCVSPAVRRLKITLNDGNWSSDIARAKGMRRLAIVQLGTAGVIDDREFAKKVSELSIRKVVPRALRHAAKVHPDPKHKAALEEAAVNCEKDGNEAAWAAVRAARAAARAAWAAEAEAEAAARAAWAAWAEAAAWAAWAGYDPDLELSLFAEEVVQILIEMKSPGAEWLDLTEAA